ncbi:ATP-binding protein [uncultured Lacinutrix sp.]|uniref:sensor histidine kinase n=1 Tax=uncultured Lacinutrix sp. TaxID=574032 RepID=UPI002624D1BC|nr:ATP-binding protein [uncultured Lacinutrix sp.]
MNKSILYLLFFYTIVSFSQSNKLYHKTYTKQDGLELDNINSLCFDNDGFLWLGGKDIDIRTIIVNNKKLALQRFNGFNFHSIPLPDYGFDYTEVHQIYKRKDGLFYIKTAFKPKHALLLFNPKTSEFTPIKFYGNLKTDALSDIINYNGKDYILSQNKRTITLNILNEDLSIKTLFSFTSNENKFLLDSSTKLIPFKDFCIIGDDNFPITILDWNGTIIKRYSPDSFKRDRDSKKNKFWIDECFVKNNILYAFINGTPILHRFNTENFQFTPLDSEKTTLNNEHLNCYTDTNNKTIIFASENQTISFNAFKNDVFKTIESTNYDKVGRIEVISKDLNDDLWLSTNGELHYYKFPKKTIKTYLKDKQLRAIKPLDSTNYIIATDNNGWYKFNTINDSLTSFKIIENEEAILPHSSRNFIVEDSIIWSNSGGNILKVNKNTHKADAYRHYPINCLEKVNDSIIIYGTNGYHLMQFNSNTNQHTSLAKTDSLEIHDIELSKDKQFLVAGTHKGLLTYNLKNSETKFYTNLEDSFILMTDYHEDYGYLLGTRSGHIIAFKPENNSLKTIYRDNLKAGIATILFEDDLWWINTFNGVVAFNPEDKTTTRFSEKDGFSHYEGNRYSAIKAGKNFLIGMIKGLNYFNPKALKKLNDSATLTLLKVKHYDKTKKTFVNNFSQELFNKNHTITLPSENRALDIDFGLKYINAVDKGYNYKYRLNNKDWVALKGKNSIQFPNLAAGYYTLEIEAKDFSGHKIGNSLFVDINSKALFYKTWWFYLIISLAVISFLLWMLNQTNTRKRLQEEFSQGLIQSQENERKRIAKELHDSISQQLTLIKKKAQHTDQKEITTLTHNTLEEVRSISRGLYPPLLRQLGLSESIEQLLLEVDEQTELFVSVDIDNIDRFFNEDQTLNCYRFIQECINNCLKHSQAKAITVSAIIENNSVDISIQDNGKGFDAINAQKQYSLGLKTISERIRILKGELIIDSKPNNGTKIIAKIPIKHG